MRSGNIIDCYYNERLKHVGLTRDVHPITKSKPIFLTNSQFDTVLISLGELVKPECQPVALAEVEVEALRTVPETKPRSHCRSPELLFVHTHHRPTTRYT